MLAAPPCLVAGVILLKRVLVVVRDGLGIELGFGRGRDISSRGGVVRPRLGLAA